jgi:GTPase Era involved in 16S rRNA processing
MMMMNRWILWVVGMNQVAIRKAITAAQLYLDQYTQFEEFLKLDIKAYKQFWQQKKAYLKDLLAEITRHRQDSDKLDRR